MKKNICVFCGASEGTSPEYRLAAEQLGKTIANQNRRLIYGGGNKGLMGIIANAVLANGGEVIGVIPERLVQAETAHHGITRLEVVENMHQRKARLSELADGFIAMPGGTGTLEEVFEVWTGMQIGYHEKPVALFNVSGFWQSLLNFLEHSVNEGFIRDSFYQTLIVSDNNELILKRMDEFVPKDLQRWVKK
ncbi:MULTISPECIES: TIGR00730 family Rossman fold protein [unclassified Gilliamella]|uniref:LOG family protein n=1 Tax=unclassified Gilliamella TaxID=2685620 RepID=UPI00226A9131|nr:MULTISPECIES: TIGR00730 family Rossman fold protein [unclassified Gilliamella]MCX8602368.1 TIGR00730 family Rossman fold protein [Gilliamella sp. B3722]MCX8608541.1 TIGR00730 family Rossman fold protein [Gilliamella sp. B3771]MCX8610351.1 TIGR00730 family Rossman fold protein [Gilliamella sp. B3891]MCX8612981.1 TIGR00730 family Rossman fold protein [Gilliamella sp. B3773]MCX8616528.1 TIGR00730 family Rossman fold protein [Gilliamella sp. B3770]